MCFVESAACVTGEVTARGLGNCGRVSETTYCSVARRVGAFNLKLYTHVYSQVSPLRAVIVPAVVHRPCASSELVGCRLSLVVGHHRQTS